MFKNLTIKARLIFAIGFLSAMLVFVGALGLIGMKQADDALETLYTKNTIPLKQLADVQKLTLRDRQLVLLMLLSPTSANIQRNLATIESSLIEQNTLLDLYRVGAMAGEEAAVYKKLVEDRKQLLEVGMLPTMAALRGGNVEEATQIAGEKLRRLYNPVADGIETIMDSKLQATKLELNQAKSRHLLILNLSIAATLIGLLLSTATGFFLIRAILRQLGGEPSVAAKVARRIAEGDFTVAIETGENDTSSLLFVMKHMSKELTNIVSEVRGATDSICTAAQQIAQGNADLSQRTEEQASSLEETASSMEQLTSTVRQNAENAKQANQLAASASDVAVKGGQVVGQVVQTMASISDSSKKIVDIISVIEGIAFQTNILALNAAVEAARAGEQGRGFAVVAGEVRNLAQRSAAAAKEIKTLIGDSVDKVGAGAKLVDQAGATMSEIVGAVKRVTDIMSEISAASSEQSVGIEQVNQAITQMDEVTQQNAALVEEAAAAAESMQRQAYVLMETVSVFRLEAVTGHQIKTATTKPAHTMAASAHSAPRRAVSSAAGAAPVKWMPKLGEAVDGTEEWKEF